MNIFFDSHIRLENMSFTILLEVFISFVKIHILIYNYAIQFFIEIIKRLIPKKLNPLLFTCSITLCIKCKQVCSGKRLIFSQKFINYLLEATHKNHENIT